MLEFLVAIFIVSFSLLGLMTIAIHPFKRVHNTLQETSAIIKLISVKEVGVFAIKAKK